jgi:hypothetical protein
LISETISGNMLVILLLFLIYLMIYLLINRLSSPYVEPNYTLLSDMEKRIIIIHISNALFAVIWISSSYERNIYSSWLIIIYVGATNFLFLLWWFKNYFGFIRKKFRFMKLYTKSILEKLKMHSSTRERSKIGTSSKKVNVDLLLEKLNRAKILNSILLNKISFIEMEFQSKDSVVCEESPVKSINFEKNVKKNIPTNSKYPHIEPSSDSKLMFQKIDPSGDENSTFNIIQLKKTEATPSKSFILREKLMVGKDNATAYLLFKFTVLDELVVHKESFEKGISFSF